MTRFSAVEWFGTSEQWRAGWIVASEQSAVPGGSVWHRSCGVWGILIVVGAAMGFAAEVGVQAVIENAWSYCVGLPWVPTYEEAPDSSRFDLFGWLSYLLVYLFSFSLGFFLAQRVARRSSSGFRVIACCVIGLLALGMVSAGDLIGNIAAPNGYSQSDRCPAGHPPGWPGWLPTGH